MDNNIYESDFEEFKKNFDKTSERIKKSLEQNLIIAFLGTGSSGKTSAIKALFDIDLGDISPIAGSTKDVKVIPVSKNVYIVDAPGFGDIKKEVSDKAKQICDDTDIFIYILNAEGGYKEQEKNDYEQLKSFGKDVLVVVNKIDLIRKDDLNDFVQDLKEKMGVEEENLILAAFNPLPRISKEQINVDKVMDWITTEIETKGKELHLAKIGKIMKEKDSFSNNLIWRASMDAFLNTPLMDPFQNHKNLDYIINDLSIKIAYIYYGSEILDSKDIEYISTIFKTLHGNIFNSFFGIFLKFIEPFKAGFLTYTIGKTLQIYFKSGMKIPEEELVRIAREYAKEAMKLKSKFKKAKNQ